MTWTIAAILIGCVVFGGAMIVLVRKSSDGHTKETDDEQMAYLEDHNRKAYLEEWNKG